jgi:hypothetical protein
MGISRSTPVRNGMAWLGMFCIGTGGGKQLYTAWNLRSEIAFPRVLLFSGSWYCNSVLFCYFGASRLPELGAAATHDFILADQLGTELTSVQCEVNVEVYSVEDTLGSIHALEVGLEVLARQVRSEGDDFLDTFGRVSLE